MRAFLFLLLLACSSAGFATSFYMGGVCYSDTAVLVEVWESRFPVYSNGDLDFTSFNTMVSSSGLMTYQINEQNIQNGSINPGSINTVQLMECTAKDNFVATGKVDRTLIVLSTVFAVLFGFNVGRNFFPDKFGGLV